MSISKSPAVNAETLAVLFNVSTRRVYQLADSGVVVKEDRGKFDLFGSIQGYIKFLQKRSLSGEGGATEWKNEKTLLVKAQRQKAELDLEVTMGNLVQKAEVEREAAEVAAIVKSSLLNIPSRVSNEFAVMQDPFEIHQKLTREINNAIGELNERYAES